MYDQDNAPESMVDQFLAELSAWYATFEFGRSRAAIELPNYCPAAVGLGFANSQFPPLWIER